MVYDTNGYLTQPQMQENAQFIAGFFIQHGWTPNAISGMLGNAQWESGINFGIYEGLDSTSSTNGFGIFQWTPNTKYFDWANSNGYANDHPNGEVNRVLYEMQNNLQWITNYQGYYNLTFQAFSVSTDSPDNLASAWMWNYERPAPATAHESDRRSYAMNWYTTLDWSGAGWTGGTGGGTGPTTNNNNDLISLLLCDALHGWK